MIKVDCSWCNNAMEVFPQRLKNRHICCSKECASALKKSLREDNVSCYTCKKPFYLKPSALAKRKNPEQVTCSVECMKEACRVRMSGESNHQYGLKGEENSSYKSGVRISSYGYALVKHPEHPKAWADGYMPIHRLIMEEHLLNTEAYEFLEKIGNRYVLSSDYEVHHVNENKLDNRLSNLEVLYSNAHKSLHGKVSYKDRTIDALGRLQPKVKIKSGKVIRTNPLDAGTDVCSNEEVVIKASDSAIISTNLFMEIPKGQVGLLWSRSGLSCKFNLEVGAGCIDSGYQGEIKVHLYNHGIEDYKVNIGDKIAQMLVLEVNLTEWEAIEEFEGITERGNGGFGSTGS